MSKQNYGNATVGIGTDEQRQIPITSYVNGLFSEGRVAQVAELGNEGLVLSIYNPENSGRSNQSIWLSEASAIALLMTMHIYYGCKGLDYKGQIGMAAKAAGIEYEYSDNLKPFNPEIEP